MDAFLQNMPPSVVLVLVLSGIAWGGLLLWGVRALLNGIFVVFDRRFSRIEKMLAADADEWRNLESQVKDLRLEMSEDYVKNDAFVRAMSVIEARQETVIAKLDRIREGGKDA